LRSRAVEEKSGKLVISRVRRARSKEESAARADLEYLEGQLRGLQLNLGRRSYVSRRVAVRVADAKIAKRLQRSMLQKINVMLSGLTAVSYPESRAGKAKSYRVILTTNIATESGKNFDES